MYIFRKNIRTFDKKTLFIISISQDSLRFILQDIVPVISNSQNSWLIKASEEDIQHLKLPFNSQCFSFQDKNMAVIIKEHYNIGQSRQIIREVGNWDESGLFQTDVPLLERRQNLQGMHKLKA